MASDLPDGYYAVPDPDDATTMTYWRVRGQRRGAWPRKARYGPGAGLSRADVPKASEPGYREFMRALFDRCDAWEKRVHDACLANPDAARRRFAELTTRCYVCGRILRDGKSKLLGIGPDCRAPFDEAAVTAAFTPAIARAHAAALTSEETPDAV